MSSRFRILFIIMAIESGCQPPLTVAVFGELDAIVPGGHAFDLALQEIDEALVADDGSVGDDADSDQRQFVFGGPGHLR